MYSLGITWTAGQLLPGGWTEDQIIISLSDLYDGAPTGYKSKLLDTFRATKADSAITPTNPEAICTLVARLLDGHLELTDL